jgi:ABC-type transporter Mla subunit MlaD
MALRKKKTLLDQASDYVEAVRPQVESAVATAVDKVEDFYEHTARPALHDAREKAGPALADARDKAAPYAKEARERAASALADARDQAKPYVAEARERAAEAASHAKETADARVAQLRGEEPPKKKGSKLRKIALFALIAGAVGFAAKKLQGGKQADNWQSSYVPTPAPTPKPTPAPAPKADDQAAADPAEAAADATEAPKPVTTPDEPAEVVDVAEDEKK